MSVQKTKLGSTDRPKWRPPQNGDRPKRSPCVLHCMVFSPKGCFCQGPQGSFPRKLPAPAACRVQSVVGVAGMLFQKATLGTTDRPKRSPSVLHCHGAYSEGLLLAKVPKRLSKEVASANSMPSPKRGENGRSQSVQKIYWGLASCSF